MLPLNIVEMVSRVSTKRLIKQIKFQDFFLAVTIKKSIMIWSLRTVYCMNIEK